MSEDMKNLETRVVKALLSLIGGGFSEGQMLLAKTASEQCEVSIKFAFSVLQKYTGGTVGDHYWTCREGRGGKSLYRLLAPA